MSTVAEKNRKKLVPLWIKVIGWFFIVMSIAVPVLPIVAPLLHQPAKYEIFGLSYQGSPFAPMALLIFAIILTLGISAYGLLFGKHWGLNACIITGYGGVVICVGTMLYSLLSVGTLEIRLELLAQVPYLIKLNKIRHEWLNNEI